MENPPVELQSLVDIHDQPFVIIDDTHRVVVVNRAFEGTYGVSIAEARGTPCHELIDSGHRPCPCDPRGDRCPFADTFTRQVPRSTAHTVLDAEGREHLVRIVAYPIRIPDGRVFIGELIQRDAIRHHPDASSAARSTASVGASPRYRSIEALSSSSPL